MPTSSAGLGLWRNYTGKATCVDEPGATWEGRDDQNCEVEWPTARAGHTSALDAKNGGVYVFGGYTTFYNLFQLVNKRLTGAWLYPVFYEAETAVGPRWAFWAVAMPVSLFYCGLGALALAAAR